MDPNLQEPTFYKALWRIAVSETTFGRLWGKRCPGRSNKELVEGRRGKGAMDRGRDREGRGGGQRGGRGEGRQRDRERGGGPGGRQQGAAAEGGMTEQEFGQRMRERLENIDQRLEMLNARLERLER